jgi:hypothetical protein
MSDNLADAQYLIYFETKFMDYRVYNPDTGEITTVAKLPRDCKKFEMLRYAKLGTTDEDLLAYAKKFKKWCAQLKKDSYCNINYAGKYCNYTAVTSNFNYRSAKNYRDHEPITTTEWRWFERCYNSGLQYLRENDITIRCYSYDFKNQYPRCMNSETKIPTKPGKEKTLSKLPSVNKLKPGFYHVKICCNDDDFRKIFSYSKHNVYVKESLEHAMKHADRFGVSFELVDDDEPNAYLYDDDHPDDMVSLRSVCGEWYEFMKLQRSKYPNNRLLKHMFSSCWSSINANNTFWKTEQQCQNENLEIGYGPGFDYEIVDEVYNPDTGSQKFKLLETGKPYKHNLRLKPWITALSRNLTAGMALKDIDNVVRIQTDSVSYAKDPEFDDSSFVPEEKTTGKIHFLTVNAYKNITTGEASGVYERCNNKKNRDD